MWSLKTKIIAGIGSMLLVLGIVTGAWIIGYNKGANISKVEISKYEKDLAVLSRKLAEKQTEIDVQVVTKFKDRVQFVDKIVYKNVEIIRNSVVEQFILSKGWVYAYNQSVLGLPIDAEKAANAEPSTTSELEALAATIVPNNGICLTNKEKLDALQQWIIETEKANANISN
jgi:hypothetical protein